MYPNTHVIETNPSSRIPVIPVALAGRAWNSYGVAQLWSSLSAGSSMGAAPYPAWMNVAFAVGVLGGTVGCAMPPSQVAVLSLVLAVAAALYRFSRRLRSRGLLY